MEQMSLDDTQVNPVARSSDPATSHEAAQSIPTETMRLRQKAIVLLLRSTGPQTDEGIADAYGFARGRVPDRFPSQSPSGLRTRRSELTHAGHVIDTGERRRTKAGRWSIVWGVPS